MKTKVYIIFALILSFVMSFAEGEIYVNRGGLIEYQEGYFTRTFTNEEKHAFLKPGEHIPLFEKPVFERESFFFGVKIHKSFKSIVCDGKSFELVTESISKKEKKQFLWYVFCIISALLIFTSSVIFYVLGRKILYTMLLIFLSMCMIYIGIFLIPVPSHMFLVYSSAVIILGLFAVDTVENPICFPLISTLFYLGCFKMLIL